MSDHDDTAGRTEQDQDKRGVRRTPRAQGRSGPRGRQEPGTAGEPRPAGGKAPEQRRRSGAHAGTAHVAGPGAEAVREEPRPVDAGPGGQADPETARVVTVDAQVTDPEPSPTPSASPVTAPEPEPAPAGQDRAAPGSAPGAWRLGPRGLKPGEVRDRWKEAQGGFVDDPRGAVRDADALAEEVADAVVAELGARRSALRSAWSDGDGSDTESLRLALRDYRSFVDHLVGGGP